MLAELLGLILLMAFIARRAAQLLRWTLFAIGFAKRGAAHRAGCPATQSGARLHCDHGGQAVS